jgi:membrane peptidoglycan carboxypeptidase
VLSPGRPPEPITPASRFNGDDGITIKDQEGHYITDRSDPSGLLHQHNDTTRHWGYITLRTAMEQSVNTPYVQLGEYVGYANVEQTALRAGLLRSSLQYDTAGFFIGTSTPSAVRMADAYATFAARGTHHEPYSVTRVLHDGEQVPGLARPQPVRAMDTSTADTVTDVLRGVIQRGTGTGAQALGRPAAGKTGTTDDYKSAWFVGYTPQLSTAVVLFKEDPQHPTLESMAGVGGYTKVFGGVMPTQVWTAYMKAALAGRPVVGFPSAPRLGKGADEPGARSPSASPGAAASGAGCRSARKCATSSPAPALPVGGASPAPGGTTVKGHGGRKRP